MSVRPRPPAPPARVNFATMGSFSGVAQDGPARKQRPSALAEELVTRGCSFIEKGIWDEAEREFRKAIKMSRDYPEAYSNLGLCLLYDGRPAEALEALEQSVKQYPNWSIAEGNLALALQRLERWEEAASYYRLSLSHNSKQPQAWLSLGDVLMALQKQNDALEAFTKAAELQPDYALAHQRVGMLQAKRGKIADAEAELQRAVRLDPNLGDAHAVLGAIAARRGNIIQAKDCFHRIVSDPIPPTAARGLRRIELFETCARNSYIEWKNAHGEARPLAECYFDLGVALVKAGNESEARAAFQKVVKLDPNNIPAQFVLAYTLELEGDVTGAKAALEKLLAQEPNNGAIAEHLGYIALSMGMSGEAETQFKKAQSLGRTLPAELVQSE